MEKRKDNIEKVYKRHDITDRNKKAEGREWEVGDK
jgi:hypothetical protein